MALFKERLTGPGNIAGLTAHQARQEAKAVVQVFRPFFVCGTVTVLTAGCLLGALALFGIAMKQNYLASAWTPYVLAHANSQLYGWVGFFVVGFSLQHHATVVSKLRAFHVLAWMTLSLLAAGILLRFVAEPLAVNGDPTWVLVGIASAVLQAIGILLYVANTSFLRHRPLIEADSAHIQVLRLGTAESRRHKPMTWPTLFVFFSLLCLLVASLVEPWIFAMSHQPDWAASVAFVARWFVPLRETQFLGFVASMVFGVGLVKFSECFGAPKADKGLGILGFAFWVAGIVARVTGWGYAFENGLTRESSGLFFVGGYLLAIGAALVVVSSGVFRKLSGGYRAHKFMRAAMGWLLGAGVMLMFEPLYLRLTGQAFSHAYVGAVRHAVTVGFISQMIVGFSSRIVPALLGKDESSLTQLWPTFWLLNIGNGLRVVLEVGTDLTPHAFRPMGMTGFIELIGLSLWGAHILRLLATVKPKAVRYAAD